MALTEEQILQQINVLTTKTSENTSMAYKANATLNKGLNPEYFSGNNTKIVNALNLLAEKNAANDLTTKTVAAKVNEILLDTTSGSGIVIWAETKELMGKDTIIEGINSILKGEKAVQILGVTEADINKVLSVAVDENGGLILKAIDQISGGGSIEKDVTWEDILDKPEVIVDGMELSEDSLNLKDGDKIVSSILLMTEADVTELIEQLN